jgi:hypothetical protein
MTDMWLCEELYLFWLEELIPGIRYVDFLITRQPDMISLKLMNSTRIRRLTGHITIIIIISIIVVILILLLSWLMLEENFSTNAFQYLKRDRLSCLTEMKGK